VPSSAIPLTSHQPVRDRVLSLLPVPPRTISAASATVRAEGDISSLCVSQADDCRLLGKLPKVKCLRNERREGKSCLSRTQVVKPDFGRGESDGAGGDISGVGDEGGQWLLGTGGPDKRRCDKELRIEMDFPPLFFLLKKMVVLRYPMRLSCSLLARKLEQAKQSPGSYF